MDAGIMNESFTPEEIARNHEIFAKRLALYKEQGLDRDEMHELLIRQIEGGVGSILEIGTGRGHLTILLAHLLKRIVSIDTDAEGQRIARLNAAYYNRLDRIEFITADAAHCGFPNGCFDAVVSAFTFHHLEYPFDVLREMARVAKRQIVLSDFNAEGFEAVARIHAQEHGSHERGGGDFGTAGVFLRENGFEVRIVEDALQTIYDARRFE